MQDSNPRPFDSGVCTLISSYIFRRFAAASDECGRQRALGLPHRLQASHQLLVGTGPASNEGHLRRAALKVERGHQQQQGQVNASAADRAPGEVRPDLILACI